MLKLLEKSEFIGQKMKVRKSQKYFKILGNESISENS